MMDLIRFYIRGYYGIMMHGGSSHLLCHLLERPFEVICVAQSAGLGIVEEAVDNSQGVDLLGDRLQETVGSVG